MGEKVIKNLKENKSEVTQYKRVSVQRQKKELYFRNENYIDKVLIQEYLNYYHEAGNIQMTKKEEYTLLNL